MDKLSERSCVPCEGGTPPLPKERVLELLGEVTDWVANDAHTAISREFRFKNYYETMAFANAVAWIAHREDHHPELAIGYKRCRVEYSTHAVRGLSENDFICASKVNSLVAHD